MINFPTRRSCLKALVAGIALPGASQGQAFRCPISFGTYGLPGFSVEDSIQLISKIGFDSIELAAMKGYHAAPDQLSKARRAEIRQKIGESGLALGALMGLPTPNASKQAENDAWVSEMLGLAKDLSPESPPMIQSVLGGGTWDEKKNLFRDCLGPWVEMAGEAGVKLAIKPHRGHAMSRPEEAIWLIDQLNATGHLTIVYDHSHFVFRELPIEKTVATALPHTRYLVMKDAIRVDDKVRFQLPGTAGTIPHTEILRQFINGGYRGEICAEVSSQVWKAQNYNPENGAQICFDNLTRIATRV